MPDDRFSPAARRALLAWYEANRRPLPMRAPGVSAWATLVFEVMSQQTPIPRVQPIWERWMELWPTPTALAAAPQAAVLVEWQHLGYPSRALRLHECAQAIVQRHLGEVPHSVEELLALPGIGPYTASALGSFQFHQRIPVLDTNIRRVLGRALDGAEFAPKSAPARREVERATALLPADGRRAATWNVALMELGALVCTQRSPQCEGCPVSSWCAWRGAGYPRAQVRPRGQSWKGTDRQARGRVMAALRSLHNEDVSPLSSSLPSLTWEEALAAATLPEAADGEQAQRDLLGLVRDGLVMRAEDTGRVHLPV